MKQLKQPSDLFNAPVVDNAPDGYTEIDCLFCDSTGYGRDYEPALTKGQAEARVSELLASNKDKDLYAAITDVGQFQLYVTIYMKGKVQ